MEIRVAPPPHTLDAMRHSDLNAARSKRCQSLSSHNPAYLLTRYVLVFMDEDIAPGLPRRPPGRRGGGYCCRMVGSDPLVAVPAAGFVAAAHNLVLAAAVAPRAAAPSVRKGLACGPTRCVLATV